MAAATCRAGDKRSDRAGGRLSIPLTTARISLRSMPMSFSRWSLSRESSRTDAETGPADHVVYSLDAALEKRPELAIIASPAAFHLDTALPLAESGVHLLVEKPLSNGLDRVDRLIDICFSRHLTLMVGYNFRFYRPLRQLKAALNRGQIGRIVAYRAEVGMYLPDWRPTADYRASASARQALGGGVLLELSHELDYTRWLLGDVTDVFAHVQKASDLDIDVEDLAELQLSFAAGGVASIHLDMIQRVAFRNCRVIGTEGTLLWDGPSHRVAMYSAGNGEWVDLHPAAEIDRNQMYLSELQYFLDCVATREPAEPSGVAGRRVL
ncbi:MAG: Gfo/Idh/MocA family oxidoreductase, partial [Proteobacteria bacterium]|nr:Gfo/Idh/MocA family oxidoreductase [Pseudomonadota bacterium]